ncbi:MAG: SIMPL domain-containing protein [Chloroflexota bacterium]
MSTTLAAPRHARTRWLAGGVAAGMLGAMIAGASLAPVAAQDTTTPQHTLSVSGTGSVSVKPDVADVTVGVTIQRDTAGDAAADAANVMDAVVTAVKALGIAEQDIQTTSLSLSPVYDYDRTPYRLVGYQANNMVTVTVRDISQVGPVIDAATGAGATDVNGITFRVADQAAAETEAREQAVKAARAKADTIAAAAGTEITGIISISETSAPMPYPMYYSADAAGAAREAAPTPVLAGTIDVEVSVSIVYSLP